MNSPLIHLLSKLFKVFVNLEKPNSDSILILLKFKLIFAEKTWLFKLVS